MKPFSFIHAADLHIDSPFRGVSTESPELAEQLQKATFQAFSALTEACVEHEVDFLLVAGDVYDGADRSLGAQLKFFEGLERLAKKGIRSFVVHGNHDPLSGRMSSLAWPEEVKIFGKTAETVTVEVDGEAVATVSGISFPKSDVRSNLSMKLKPGLSGLFNIGLLHTNVGSDTGHEAYAPCELSELESSGMSYWALGHVHTRAILCENPLVVYPGNLQGRSIREQGARGCYLVRVDAQGVAEMEFLALDVVRWHETTATIEGLETIDALDRKLGETLETLSSDAEGRGIVCRLRIEGRGPLYGVLHAESAVEDLLTRLRERFAGLESWVWVQRIELDCRPEVDLGKRAEQGDLLAEVLTVASEYSSSAEGLDRLEAAVLDDLWKNTRAHRTLAQLGPDHIREILAEAELLCLDLLENDE